MSSIIKKTPENQKQPPEVFYEKRCSEKFHKIHRSLFLVKKRLWHRFFPVNFARFLRTPFLQNTSGRLLLERISSEVYLEPTRTTTMELFWEKINYFRKKDPSQMSDWVLNTPVINIQNLVWGVRMWFKAILEYF